MTDPRSHPRSICGTRPAHSFGGVIYPGVDETGIFCPKLWRYCIRCQHREKV